MTKHQELLNEIYERAIAERAVTCEAWLWGDGMLVSVPPEDGVGPRSIKRLVEGENIDPEAGLLPVFADACTRGCLLAMVRHAYGKEGYLIVGCAQPEGGGTPCFYVSIMRDKKSTTHRYYPTEAEALVGALEDASAQLKRKGGKP
jgi:hypothetical protein